MSALLKIIPKRNILDRDGHHGLLHYFAISHKGKARSWGTGKPHIKGEKGKGAR